MKLEDVNTEWFDENSLRLPDYKVGRVSYGDYGRAYIRINETGLERPFRLYTSLTTAINQCAPMEKPLLEWYCKNGLVEANRLLRAAQHYGTIMHKCIGKLLIERHFDFGKLQEIIDDYCAIENFYDKDIYEWPIKLKHDITAFIFFTKERNLIPLGIEFVLLSDRGFGTPIDIICKMDISEEGYFGEVYKSGDNKGQPKLTKKRRQITAIINLKSGRHQFYRTNGIQVEFEKRLFEENFPDIKIDACFNWSPKDWDVNPGYNIKDWQDEIEDQEIDAILQLADIRFSRKAIDRKYVDIYGTQWIDRELSIVHISTVEEYCIKKFSTQPL